MSCEISHGRVEECKDSVSGLKAIYIINFDDLNEDSAVFDTVNADESDELESWIPVDTATPLNIYKYELKSTANALNTTINASRDNGTTFFTQELVVNLKRQDVVTHKQVKLLSYGRPRIIARSMTDQFFLLGFAQGCDVSAGTIGTGAALGDFNGYQLTFTAEEELPPLFIDCNKEEDAATGLDAVFNNGTDDANIVSN
jgi:hypothetical protein